jgi:hypothetical protein
MSVDKMQRRVRISGFLVLLGLVIELGSLSVVSSNRICLVSVPGSRTHCAGDTSLSVLAGFDFKFQRARRYRKLI